MEAQVTLPTHVQNFMRKLESYGFEAYVIGGAVRDSILGVEPKDYDIFTNATGEQILTVFPNGHVVGNEERQAKILTVVVYDVQDAVEISTYRKNGKRTETGNSLLEHLKTCDFDVNSIACNSLGFTIDPNRGIDSLKKGEFRFVGNPEDRIHEDPLRLLRGIRLQAKYGLYCVHKSAIIRYKNEILKLPKERIREELLKILKYDNGISLLGPYLDIIVPKFKENIGCPGGPHHAESVDVHLLDAFRIAKTITDNQLVHIAALLHDIAKGETMTNDNGEIHFFEHEDKGAEYARKWMEEYKFSNHAIQVVHTLIKNHMWQYSDVIKKSSFVRLFRELEDNGVTIYDFVAIKYSDHQANQKNPRVKFNDFIRHSSILQKYFSMKYSKEPFKVQDLCVGGKDLLEMGLAPGKEIGMLLEGAFTKVMDGELTNSRPELMNYLRSRILEKKQS
jgi:tRNA nucleotidyltransferase (CCA-adding enzyme)